MASISQHRKLDFLMSLNSLVYVHYNSKLCKQEKEESVDEFVQCN